MLEYHLPIYNHHIVQPGLNNPISVILFLTLLLSGCTHVQKNLHEIKLPDDTTLSFFYTTPPPPDDGFQLGVKISQPGMKDAYYPLSSFVGNPILFKSKVTALTNPSHEIIWLEINTNGITPLPPVFGKCLVCYEIKTGSFYDGMTHHLILPSHSYRVQTGWNNGPIQEIPAIGADANKIDDFEVSYK